MPLDGGVWRPVRRSLGVTALGVNAYTGDRPGDEVIERHDETSPGSAGHEEVYLVMRGRASFTIGGARVDAPAGTMIRVDLGVMREAVAAEAGTTVVVVGGRPGAALPSPAYEHWYAAQPAYDSGDPARALAIASEGLRDWPAHGPLRYQLACFAALAGRPDEAVEHLRVAFDRDPRTREWAADDEDLAGVRDDPRLAG